MVDGMYKYDCDSMCCKLVANVFVQTAEVENLVTAVCSIGVLYFS